MKLRRHVVLRAASLQKDFVGLPIPRLLWDGGGKIKEQQPITTTRSIYSPVHSLLIRAPQTFWGKIAEDFYWKKKWDVIEK